MTVHTIKRNTFQRILGIPVTPVFEDCRCYQYGEGSLYIDLALTEPLARAGGAICLEGGGLPERVLVVHGDDDCFYAFRNRCAHLGRRLDADPVTHTVQCCSLGQSIYGFDGEVLGGATHNPLVTFPVERQGKFLVIHLKAETTFFGEE